MIRGMLHHVYVDSIVHGAPKLLYLIEILGAERIGSDVPSDMGVQNPVPLFVRRLSEDMRQQILAGPSNLLRSSRDSEY